jgi:glycogen synthase
MRVLAIGSVYPPHHLGGYELIWSGVMRHLRGQGHEVRVLTTDYRRPGVSDEAEPDVHRELEWYWREHEWRSLSPRATLALERHNAVAFDRHLREFEADVITWWPVGGMSLSLIERARRSSVPAVLFVLDPWISYAPRRDLWLRMWSRLRPLAHLADAATGIPTTVDYGRSGRFVFCSETVRREFTAAGLDPSHSTILSPGVDGEFLSFPPEPAPPPWRWRLLYAGRVVEQKGVATAVEALALLPAEATLRIVGDGDASYARSLRELAARLGVSARVSFEPFLPTSELIAVYRAADAVLFPVAWDEPWGLVPLEAMALGRPVIATGRGGSSDYLAGGENALLFQTEDAGALAAAVKALATDPPLRERLIAGGLRTAMQHTADAFNQQATAEIEAAISTAPTRATTQPPRA